MSKFASREIPELNMDGQLYLQCECGDLYPIRSYGAGFMVANEGVCENCDAEKVAIPAPIARDLLGELYQVLGSLDAGAEVLDQVSAAINGQPLPHETLLPYVGSASEMQAADQPRLVSYSEAMETCTLHHQGREYYFTLDGRSDEEHELLGYIEPPVLLDLLQGSDAATKIRSAVPSPTNPDPGPGESWAVPIYVVRRPGGQQ